MSDFKNKCLEDEFPVNKLLVKGASSLSDAELLAIILRTGTKDKDPIELGREVLSLSDGKWGLLGLHHFSVDDFMKISGIGEVKAAQLVSIAEIAKRITVMKKADALMFNNPDTVAAYYMEKMRYLEKEHLKLVLLDNKGRLINEMLLSIGTVDSTIVSSKDIFYNALKDNASGFILLHNHPSGDPTPSRQDLNITQKIKEVSELVEIPILDHIIIGDNQYTSFKKEGLL